MNDNYKDPGETALLSESLNIIPQGVKDIHIMGICGTGMASLAGMLKQLGYVITGSDANVYPPMSDFLEETGIPVMKGYSPKNLLHGPDLVVVGNVITRHNPEARELSRLKIPYISMPQALRRFAMEDKRSIVVSGTHGKTTTSSIISWVLERAGMEPGFMIGGILNNFKGNFKLGKGSYFIVEGDEYDTAFFDKGSKFLHYAPWVAIITSIEFDHADIFKDFEEVKESFRRFINLIPPDGLLIANADDPVVMEESRRVKCPVVTYGLKGQADWRAVDILTGPDLTRFRILKREEEYMSLSTNLYGDHNVSNLLSAVALSEALKISPSILSQAMGSFGGVKRRQEIRGEKEGILVLDDFAHHPTAVEKTIQAVKERYKDRRLLAVFEPRSNSSRRNIFQDRYASSFDKADLIFIPEPPMMEKIPPGERFSSKGLVKALIKRGLDALYCPDSNSLLKSLIGHVKRGDVILIMSNGSFDNLHERLLKRL